MVSKKLFLAFLGLTVILLIATLGLARWSFQQGFLDYVNALEEQRLQLLAASLSREYLDAGNSWLKLNSERFNTLLREHSPGNPQERHRSGRPPPPGFMLPPPEFPLENADEMQGSGRRPPPPDFMSRPPGFPPPAPPVRGPPTALFDMNGQFIAGRVSSLTEITPISVPVIADGNQVGELKSAPRRHFESSRETAFSRQQLTTSLLIAIVAIILASLIAWLLTRVLLAPIRRMMNGVAQLSDGDYSTRLEENRYDELGQLMFNLNRLAQQLEENQVSRRRWLADISHELRTPVTVLTGEIESMKDGILPIDMQQILSLDQEMIRLRHLIKDLYELSVSDIGGLHYSFVRVSLQECLSSTVDLIQKRISDQQIELELCSDSDVMINGDPQRLEQLFINLLENALAYTDSPGGIEISIARIDRQASIKIQDTPPGVSEEDCNKLFDPLYRLETSRSRRTAGAGLGLAICKNIVKAHQGCIKASPSKLGGLCIHILLPIQIEK